MRERIYIEGGKDPVERDSLSESQLRKLAVLDLMDVDSTSTPVSMSYDGTTWTSRPCATGPIELPGLGKVSYAPLVVDYDGDKQIYSARYLRITTIYNDEGESDASVHE